MENYRQKRYVKNELFRRLEVLHGTIEDILIRGRNPHIIYPVLFRVVSYLWGKNFYDITKK